MIGNILSVPSDLYLTLTDDLKECPACSLTENDVVLLRHDSSLHDPSYFIL